MAAVFPALPTDNLYKFLALFGLVLFVFAIFFPEEKLARPLAQVQEADKARRIERIRIDRKKGELDDAFKQLQDKVAEQGRNKQQSEDVGAKLQARGDALIKSLTEEAKRSLKSKAVKDLYAQTKALDPEYQALFEKMRQTTDAIRKTTDDILKLKPRYAEVGEELAIAKVNVEAETEAIDELNWQITLWYSVAIGSTVIGFVMMVSGFQLWYKKVQVYQDALLRKQAADIESDKTK